MHIRTSIIKHKQIIEEANDTPLAWKEVAIAILIIISGSFTYNIYPVILNIGAIIILVSIFYNYLHKSHFLFFTYLLIGNLFIFGNKYGGVYNISAFIAIVLNFLATSNSGFKSSSSFPQHINSFFFLWVLSQILSVLMGNSFGVLVKVQAIISFTIVISIIYFISKIKLTFDNLIKFLVILCLMTIYMFIVALNQKYTFLNVNLPFFPAIDTNIDFELGIIRSGSTLNNFEAYAEYSVSVIALLLPGILSGSFVKENKGLFYLCIGVVIIGVIGIVLSGTRSSIMLIPIVILATCLFLGRKLKLSLLALFICGASIFFLINQSYGFIDTSVFTERSDNIDFEHLTLGKLISGEEMNRGEVFSYALKQVKNSNGLFGKGYFMTPDEYRVVHFESGTMGDSIADFHNIYMSAYVLWGIAGLSSLLIVFFTSLHRGFKVYRCYILQNNFLRDVLLGFNLMFIFFLINQFKIQFIRDINYFMLILLLITLYNILIEYIIKLKTNIVNDFK